MKTVVETLNAIERRWHYDSSREAEHDLAYAFFAVQPDFTKPERCIAISSLHLLAAMQLVAALVDDGVKFTVRLMKRAEAIEAFAPNQTATSQPLQNL